MGQEYEWAEALRKAKHEAIQSDKLLFRTKNIVNDDKKELFEEQFAYYKTKLKEMLSQKKSAKEIEDLVHRIINVHAKLTSISIHEEKENGALDTSDEILEHIRKYFSDCSILLSLIPQET